MAKKPEKPLLILGTRQLAAEIADLASEVTGYRVDGFVENEDRARCEDTLEGLPIHWIDDIGAMKDGHWAAGGLMTTHRGRFADQVDAIGMPFATLVHPMARVSPTATLADGVIVSAGAVIAAHTRLGRHVFVNRGALVGHHTEIGGLSSLGPGVNIASLCGIGDRVYFGSGAIVIDRISIGAPARVVERDIDGK